MAKGKKGSKKKKSAQSAPADVPLGTKLQYVGVGVVLGVIAGPTVRKWIERARPEVDKLFERLTTQAEQLAENASDWMANARGKVADGEGEPPKSGHEGHSH